MFLLLLIHFTAHHLSFALFQQAFCWVWINFFEFNTSGKFFVLGHCVRNICILYDQISLFINVIYTTGKPILIYLYIIFSIIYCNDMMKIIILIILILPMPYNFNLRAKLLNQIPIVLRWIITFLGGHLNGKCKTRLLNYMISNIACF